MPIEAKIHKGRANAISVVLLPDIELSQLHIAATDTWGQELARHSDRRLASNHKRFPENWMDHDRQNSALRREQT